MSKVKLTSAIKLDQTSLSAITDFAKKRGASANPEITVDPKLLAGFVLEIDGTQYDYSLSGALNRLGKALEV